VLDSSSSSEAEFKLALEAAGGVITILKAPCQSRIVLEAIRSMIYKTKTVDVSYRQLQYTSGVTGLGAISGAVTSGPTGNTNPQGASSYPYIPAFESSDKVTNSADDLDDNTNDNDAASIGSLAVSEIGDDDWSDCSSILPTDIKTMRRAVNDGKVAMRLCE